LLLTVLALLIVIILMIIPMVISGLSTFENV